MIKQKYGLQRRLLVWAIAAASIVLPAQIAAAQGSTTVTGKVTSEAGRPLQFASVSITALGLGAQTDGNGRYTFVVPSGRVLGQTAQLSVRALGYRPSTASITITAGTVAKDFVLAANPLRLDEVVVTGSGTSSTREVLGTVTTTVEAAEIMKSSERNLVNSLASKAAGVTIVSSSGDPGAGTSITIRGISTIQGDGQPLFVVDGMPIDNSAQQTTSGFGDGGGAISSNRLVDLNPADVESVEILKGAAAAAIYGQRAANGVILITTKSGRAGATRYSWSTNLNLDNVNRAIPLQRTFGLGNGGTTPACNFTSGTPNCTNRGRNWGPALAAGTQTYDQFGDLFRTATNLDNQLSISGGDAARTFFLSLGAQPERHHQGPEQLHEPVQRSIEGNAGPGQQDQARWQRCLHTEQRIVRAAWLQPLRPAARCDPHVAGVQSVPVSDGSRLCPQLPEPAPDSRAGSDLRKPALGAERAAEPD